MDDEREKDRPEGDEKIIPQAPEPAEETENIAEAEAAVETEDGESSGEASEAERPEVTEGERKAPSRRVGRKRKKKEPLTLRLVISRILIYTGLALIVFAAGYEIIDYPWNTVFQKDRIYTEDDVPDPPPFNDSDYIIEYESSEPSPSPSFSASDQPSPSEEAESEEPSIEDGLAGDGILTVPSKSPGTQIKLTQLGIVKIPKLDISEYIFKGSSQRELGAGTGYVVGTAGFGKKGNLCIAGHRSTPSKHPFKYLMNLEAGDIIIVKNDDHSYTYAAIEHFIVDANETWVLKKVEDIPYCLTLITCHPYGSAKQRVILRAELIEVDGEPFIP